VKLARGSIAPVSLTVGAGEIVAIAGATGVGKTTLLRTLLGLEPPVSGAIVFDGASIDAAEAGPRARPFAWVPQDGARLGAAGRAVSGGERQWIALARALATKQPVLLMDEPTSGLDAESQERVLAGIARLRGERSVVIVTHRPEPLKIADRVVHLA
jgi:ABC-type bacteriocin/lantibiotic exporter with double-glycine peptidase domain